MRAERPDDLVRRVTRRVAAIRRLRGLTQEELAEKLGTATKNMQRIEAGQNVTLKTIGRLAAALGVRASELFDERPLPVPKKQTRKRRP